MNPRNSEALRCANSTQAILHESAVPVCGAFRTDGAGIASYAALMLGGRRELRRAVERDTRKEAARGNRDAAELLAAVADLRRRSAAGDVRADRIIASIISGR